MNKEKLLKEIYLFLQENPKESKSSLSRKAVGNSALIRRWEEGREPTLKNAYSIFKIIQKRNTTDNNTQINIAQTDNEYSVTTNSVKLDANTTANEQLMQLFDVQASTCFEAEVGFENITKQLLFEENSLRKLGLYEQNLVAIRLKGDSMEPVLKDKDIILIDTADKILTVGKIVALKHAKELQVKRLQRLEDNVWLACSDNTKYAPFKINDNNIIGSVLWFGRWNLYDC